MDGVIRARKERLVKLRKMLDAKSENGMSAEEIGELMGIRKSTYYLYENPINDNFLSRHKLDILAEKTGVRKEWLLNGEEPIFQNEKINIPVQAKIGVPQRFELSIDPNATEIIIILRRG